MSAVQFRPWAPKDERGEASKRRAVTPPSDHVHRMLDHLSLGTTDLARAIAFYDASLAPLGIVRLWTRDDAVGYGYPGGDDGLAIKRRERVVTPGPGFHVALTARSRSEVEAFFRAALAHGGQDHGEPGLRPQYGPDYYAAFVADPDGHRVEAVCHALAATPTVPGDIAPARVTETFFSVEVDDMQRATAFYVDALAASVLFASRSWSSLQLAGVRLGLFLHPGHPAGRVGLHFVVRDLAAARADIERAGGRVVAASIEVAPGMVIAEVTDTEGNSFTLRGA